MENPMKMDDFGGTPIFGNIQYGVAQSNLERIRLENPWKWMSMVSQRIHGTIVYLPTWMVDFYGTCRQIYNRPMDPLGMSLGFVSGDLRRPYINGSRESNVVDWLLQHTEFEHSNKPISNSLYLRGFLSDIWHNTCACSIHFEGAGIMRCMICVYRYAPIYVPQPSIEKDTVVFQPGMLNIRWIIDSNRNGDGDVGWRSWFPALVGKTQLLRAVLTTVRFFSLTPDGTLRRNHDEKMPDKTKSTVQ